MSSNKALHQQVFSVFFSFAIPSVLGMLAVTSAGIIDGMFVGNYVGIDALAAISICAPIYPILFGVPILFSTGGEVFCGKFIGEKNFDKAKIIFTQITLTIAIISFLFTLIGLFNVERISVLLGADDKIKPLVVEYLTIIIAMTPLLSCYALTYFVRVDGKPNLSFIALLSVAVLNIMLDYYFIVIENKGVQGAALGTCLSYFALPVLLLPHFLLKKGNLSFKLSLPDWKVIQSIAYNGSSEFLSELSGGFLFYLINLQMMKYYGTDGVAAYAVVGYLVYFMTMLCYGMSDALKSVVSINFGAKLFKRVIDFLKVSVSTSVILGGVMAFTVNIFIHQFIDLFLGQDGGSVKELTETFVRLITPILLFIGVNILLSSFFTALHLPKPSLILSFLRTLLLPVSLMFVLTNYLGGVGVIDAILYSEIITLISAIVLFIYHFKKVKWVDQ